jgi:hypothetical protein
MTTQELDKKIGMPDINQEWAKFEKETIAPHRRLKSFTAKAAAVAGIIFLLGGAVIASAVISSNSSTLHAVFATDDDPIYDVVEENPVYADGLDALMQHLIQNLHYPKVAEDCGVAGRVMVQFVVEKDGRCTQFKVLKEATDHRKLIKRNVQATGKPQDRDYITMSEFETAQKACHDEALRVCRMMGKWTPGKIKGKAVRTHFTIPVTFRLQ